ncbi:MAG: hypothetical protein OXC45_01925 [Gemmatimonadetes bacterium]|nr:hypothetical protein [Gemmatimonadota bacterium]
MKNFERYAPYFLILISLVIAVSFAYVATTRTLTDLETVFLQFFCLLAGTGGSFIFGRQSAREAAREIIKPHARSAFRRLLSLYQSLSRVATTIESSQNFESPVENQVTLAKLETIVVEQLASADDAIEEWKDIVPEDVEELDRRFSSDKTTRDRQ